jgi:hypothetical protein
MISEGGAAAAFGWGVDVECSDKMLYVPGYAGNWVKHKHYMRVSEETAKRRALLGTKHGRAVIRTQAFLTEDDYIRAYGNYWERGF